MCCKKSVRVHRLHFWPVLKISESNVRWQGDGRLHQDRNRNSNSVTISLKLKPDVVESCDVCMSCAWASLQNLNTTTNTGQLQVSVREPQVLIDVVLTLPLPQENINFHIPALSDRSALCWRPSVEVEATKHLRCVRDTLYCDLRILKNHVHLATDEPPSRAGSRVVKIHREITLKMRSRPCWSRQVAL